ncbi:MAG: MFS transporter, partial [Hyphomicrobiaceae bacterium]
MAQPFAEPCSRGLITAEPCPRELGREITPLRRRMVLIACVLASSMAFIDGSALTVALPKLKTALGADLASVQWVVNGYVLALAALTLIGGALADAYGKARMLALGCLLFGVASAACALAPTIAWLVAARIGQGIAGAIVTPASLALIGATYPRAERNRAIGVWAAASALTTAGGPILGGWQTETFGWQFVFWINPPLALAALALLAAYAPEDQREARRLDMVGAAMLAAALATLERFLLDVNRNCHGGFPRSRKSDSSAPSAAAEGAMAKGYSKDLRERAVAMVEDGESRREVARLLNLAPSTAVRWLDRWARTGSIAAKPGTGHSRSPLTAYEQWLLDL